MEAFRYCPHCARPLQPHHDGERWRSRCEGCNWIHYRNPTVGVAVVLIEEDRLLLGKRRSGGWCIPCGHVEWDEPIEEAAVREFHEETGLSVQLNGVLAVHSNFHNPKHHTVGVWYKGMRLPDRDEAVRPGGDLVDVGFHPFSQLPELKFPTDRLVIAGLARDGLRHRS